MTTPRGGDAQASGTKRNHNDVTPSKKAKQPSVPGMKSGYDEASEVQLEAFTHFWPWLRDALPGARAVALVCGASHARKFTSAPSDAPRLVAHEGCWRGSARAGRLRGHPAAGQGAVHLSGGLWLLGGRQLRQAVPAHPGGVAEGRRAGGRAQAPLFSSKYFPYSHTTQGHKTDVFICQVNDQSQRSVHVCTLPRAAMRKCLFWLQEHGAPAMQLILNDLPTNNWARCVSNFVTGEGAPAAPDNYTVTLAPKSFYSALVRHA